MEEKSAKSRLTDSKKFIKLNPGYVDDTSVGDLKGFKQAINTRDDPAYKMILSKCSSGSVKTASGMSHPSLTPKQDTTYEEFKDWRRGKKTEIQ